MIGSLLSTSKREHGTCQHWQFARTNLGSEAATADLEWNPTVSAITYKTGQSLLNSVSFRPGHNVEPRALILPGHWHVYWLLVLLDRVSTTSAYRY